MNEHRTHDQKQHGHKHGGTCGHRRVKHDGHEDYLHDGHLHFVHGDHVDEHNLAVSASNPATCDPSHTCGGHDRAHQHGSGCGHEAIPHGDHTDYLVGEHLHHQHNGHCDDHGRVAVG
jgi:hypothetical protein